MRSFLVLVFLLFSFQVMAEYRVFTLHIINHQSQNVRIVESTLDPVQYRGVYPLEAHESITYVETRKCLGRTDFHKSYCRKPAQQDQQPEVVTIQSPEIQ